MSDLLRQIPDRFEVLEQLGKGGMGAVFKVRDEQDGRVVALKSLLHDGGKSRKRFLREFSAISRLEHPGLLRVEQFFDTPTGACFTMELVDGVDLSRAMDQPWQRLVTVLGQVLAALAYIHLQRIVHRDIKPQNVMLAGWHPGHPLDGVQAKLADFGIAKDLGAETATQLTARGDTVGTLAYMAPEQARGEPVDGRSDLYAFGVLLYELVTGNRPFRGATNNVRLMVAREMGQIVDPLEHQPQTPPLLRDLLLSLLCRQPAGRPVSAAVVDVTLRQLALPEEAERTVEDHRVMSSVFVLPSLHGRDGELQRLAQLTREGSASCVLLEGAAGIGKTALLESWRRQLVRDGAVVLYASCEGGSDDAPQLAERLARHHRDLQQQLGTPGAELLQQLLQLTEPSTLDPLTSGAAMDSAAGLAAMPRDPLLADRMLQRQIFDLWLQLAPDQPLVVIVEDLQRADPSQAELLGAFVTYLKVEQQGLGPLSGAARRARLVLSGRPLVQEGPARQLETSLVSRRLLDRVHLAPLEPQAAQSMVAELLGLPAEPCPAAAQQILARAGGVPMLIEGLVRHHVQSSSRGDEDSGDATGQGSVDSEGHSGELSRLVETEISRMGPGALGVLRLAAVQGARFELELLVQQGGETEDRVLQVLDLAVRLGLVQEDPADDGCFGFAQALVPEILLSQLSAARLRLQHRHAAEALEAIQGNRKQRQPGAAARIARHLLASDHPSQAVPHLLQAAAESLHLKAHGEAARALARALEQGGEQVVDAGFARSYADALVGDGELEQGLTWYQRALELRGPDARLAVRASRVALRLSRLDRASELAFLALDGLDMRPPRGKVGSSLSMLGQQLSLDLGWLNRLERGLAQPAAMPAAGPPPPAEQLRWDAMSQLCQVEMLRFTDIWAALAGHMRLLKQLLKLHPGPTDPLLAERLAFHACMFMEYGSRGKSRRMVDAALGLAARTPREPACLDAVGQALVVVMADADLAAAVTTAQRYLPLTEQHAQRSAAMMTLQTLVESLTFQGRFQQAARGLDRIRRTASHLQDQHILLQADGQQAFLEVYQDPTESTLELWEAVIQRARATRDRFVDTWFSVFRPHALLRVRGLQAALEAVPEAEQLLGSDHAYLHTRMAGGYIGLILSDELWRRGGTDRQLVGRINVQLKTIRRTARKVRLLRPLEHMLAAELAMAAGDVGAGEQLFRQARRTEHARQSPLMAFQIDSRAALWAQRRGESGARRKLGALAALATEDGWKGEARLLEDLKLARRP